MKPFSPRVIGFVAAQLPSMLGLADIELLFVSIGLGTYYAAGGSAVNTVAGTVRNAQTAAGLGDQSAIQGLNDLVFDVARRWAPEDPHQESEEVYDAPWRELKERLRADSWLLRVTVTTKAGPWDTEFMELDGIEIVPMDEPAMPASRQISALKAELGRLGYIEAQNHYQQAVTCYETGMMEAANGQLRSMYEALVVQFASAHGFTPPPRQSGGGNAINHLTNRRVLSEVDGGLIKAVWNVSHTNGSHPGVTTAAEVSHRMLSITGAAWLLIERLEPPAP